MACGSSRPAKRIINAMMTKATEMMSVICLGGVIRKGMVPPKSDVEGCSLTVMHRLGMRPCVISTILRQKPSALESVALGRRLYP